MTVDSSGAFHAEVEFLSSLIPVTNIQMDIGVEMLKTVGAFIRDKAKERARTGMKTGNFVGLTTPTLEESVKMVFIERGFNPKVEIGTDKDYGAFWEFGHRNVYTGKKEKNSWLTNAFMKNIVEAVNEARRKVDRLVKRKRLSITQTRTFLYTSGKFLNDMNAIVAIPGLSGLRSGLFRSGRLLGDVSAISKGTVKQRLFRRGIGRGLGRGPLRRISTGSYRVPRRIIRRVTGRKIGNTFSTRLSDHMRSP